MKKLKGILVVFKEAAKLLVANSPLRMAGATAFFATFALPPMLIIIVRTLGLFFDRRTLGREIMGKVGNVLGSEQRRAILAVVRGVRGLQVHPLATALIFLFLLFVATTLFKVIKDCINQLWRIRLNKNRKLVTVLLWRLKATVFILFTGVLVLAVMAAEVMQAYLGSYLAEISPVADRYAHSFVTHIVSLVVVTAWFFVLFRFLPDGRPRARINLAGALAAGLLFNAGKYVLRWALSGNIREIYGASGALVVILLFVFYSALILYYCAALTRVLALHFDNGIKPLPHASGYRIITNDVVEQAPL